MRSKKYFNNHIVEGLYYCKDMRCRKEGKVDGKNAYTCEIISWNVIIKIKNTKKKKLPT